MNIAFICIGNTSRSQMAESWAAHIAPKGFNIFSAGTRPGKGVKQRVTEIMNDIGSSTAGQYSKPLSELPDELDYLILMGEGVECPDLGEKHREDWGFPDLDGSDLSALCELRDAIREKVDRLITSLS